MQDRIDAINERIAAACDRSGRDLDEVKLVAVSKTYPPEKVREAAECGLRVFGESRIPEAEAKIPMCPGNLEWELIGHLQRNKVRRALRLFDTIHAVDSLELLRKINLVARELGKTPKICLEVNVSGEPSKYGFVPTDVLPVLNEATGMMNVDVAGLMTIPPFTTEPENSRKYFRQLRDLRDKLAEESGFPLDELSMGMSGDFEVAIEEGATCVRIGTAIFGSRK